MENHRKAAPHAGDIVELVLTREVWVYDKKDPHPKPGKMNYLGGRKADKEAKEAENRKKRRVVIETRSQGRYFGDGKRIVAFVTLDPDETNGLSSGR
ncbi:hypothetical protein AGMMS50225_12660 [Betaproteobacteria bacterium]|nr:hypothetical protein AGMMS50225_12660 [Betaproteobacteria bacterium]GHU22381.1 hypothetical protein FACS189488_02820 [Betaproteobacteria bacterium]